MKPMLTHRNKVMVIIIKNNGMLNKRIAYSLMFKYSNNILEDEYQSTGEM